MPLSAPNVHIKKQEVRWEVPFSTKYCKAKKIFSIVHFVARKKRSNYWRKNVTEFGAFGAKVTPHMFLTVTSYAPKICAKISAKTSCKK